MDRGDSRLILASPTDNDTNRYCALGATGCVALDGVEKAIRAALEKGDAADKSFRDRVYGQAFAALDRTAASNPAHTAETIAARRHALQRTVALIESEFAPALGGVSRAESGARSAPAVEINRPGAGGEPSARRAEPMSGARAEPSFGPPPQAPDVGSAAGPEAGFPAAADPRECRQPPRRRLRRLARVLVAVTILAAVAMFFWWAYGSGLLGGRIDGSVPNPPQVLEDEEFSPPAGSESQAPLLPQEADAEAAWIGIFSPSDPTTVSAPAGASADVMEADGESFLRVRSGSDAQSAVVFDVGQGILEQIAGRRAVFSVVAQAEGNSPLQMSVDCDLGALGDCGRRRYDVGIERGEYLFDLEVPQGSPNGIGTIRISTALSGEPRALDIFEIRVSVAE